NVPLIGVGFSLSGNVILKLLGEQKEPIADNLVGAIAVAPPINLSLCSDALSRNRNRVYDIRFMRLLKQAMKERQQRFPEFPRLQFKWNMRIRDFDEICTAPLNNFKSAEDYYRSCSSKQFLACISLPTYLLASDDDPFVPERSFDNLPDNKFLNFNLTRGGGHMGYVSAEKTPLGSHRWLDYAVLTYAESLIKKKNGVAAQKSGSIPGL
ncbi:MAG: YheT family hydrolase, partial [bacterium]